MAGDEVVLSQQTKQRIEQAFRAYWLSPLCSGDIEVGETVVSWALGAARIGTKAFADAFNVTTKTAYQIKTGLLTSPVTFGRLTTPSQFELVNSPKQEDLNRLGRELLEWVWRRINEPKTVLEANQVRVARVIYSQIGNFTYYERDVSTDPHDPQMFTWKWSNGGKALEGYYSEYPERQWFSWYPQGRLGTRNQNQLHFHGENKFIPSEGALNRYDFYLGKHARISFDDFMGVLQPLIDALPEDRLL